MPGTGRYLATDEGKAAVTRMKTILDGGLIQSITDFINNGDQVADPNLFDGPHARTYGSEWPGTKTALRNAHAELQQLATALDGVITDIQAAAGSRS
jgi:hypothetical protein